MLDLSLTIFGRYLSLHIGRVTDVWEDDATDLPTEDASPVEEQPDPVLDKPSECVYVEDRWYD